MPERPSVGGVVELAAAITILVTIGNVRSNVVKRNPGLTEAQWHAVVTGQLEPTAVAAIGIGLWLVELAAVALIFHLKLAGPPSGASRITPGS